jgi:hypothetical protein
MKQHFLQISIAGLFLLFGGCNGKTALPKPVDGLPAPTAVIITPEIGLPEETPAATEIVSRFMTAILHGESQTIYTLLTPLARQKNKEMGIAFTPQTSHTASFTIDHAVPQGENCVYVHTTLTDLNENGENESAEIVWIVTKNEEGWRIFGAAVALFDGQDKTLLNFEDPEAAQNAISIAEIQSVLKVR